MGMLHWLRGSAVPRLSSEEMTMTHRTIGRTWMTAGLLWMLGACGEDATGSGGAGGEAAATGPTNAATGSTAATQGGTGGGGAQAPVVEVLASFDGAAFELPEGLAVRGGDVLVGFALSSTIDRFDLDGGGRAAFASLPLPPPNTGFMTGLTTSSSGEVLAALASFSGDPVPGAYVAPEGGPSALFASHAELVLPNGFAWSASGSLFLTDSARGAVFVATPQGATSLWAEDPLLAGDPVACGGEPDDLVIGANGIVWTPDAVIVASHDQGLVARIPIEADGSAGALEILAGPDCDLLAGIDGLTLDVDGTVVGAVNRSNRIVRLDASGAVTVLLEGPPLDFPASVAFGGTGDDRALYVTNFAIANALAGLPASPGLLRVKL